MQAWEHWLRGIEITVLLFQARLLPFIPSGFVTLAGAISNINLLHFLVATALGKLLSIALEALVSFDVININTNWIRDYKVKFLNPSDYRGYGSQLAKKTCEVSSVH